MKLLFLRLNCSKAQDKTHSSPHAKILLLNCAPDAPGELDLYFAGFPAGEYWILDTDYESYTAIYTCGDRRLLNIRSETAWIMTREPNPPQETVCICLEK